MNTMAYSFIGSPAVYWRTDTVLDVWKTDVNKSLCLFGASTPVWRDIQFLRKLTSKVNLGVKKMEQHDELEWVSGTLTRMVKEGHLRRWYLFRGDLNNVKENGMEILGGEGSEKGRE